MLGAYHLISERLGVALAYPTLGATLARAERSAADDVFTRLRPRRVYARVGVYLRKSKR